MALNRFSLSEQNDASIHSPERILAKLDSSLSDCERRQFLAVLVRSPETLAALTVVENQWQIQLLKKQQEIAIIKEKIRMKEIWIDAGSKHRSSFYDVFSIDKMRLSKNEDEIILKIKEIELEASQNRATKTLDIFGPILKERMAEVEAKIAEENSPGLRP